MNNKWEGNSANRQKGHQLVYNSDFRAFPADTFLLQSSCLLLGQTSGVCVPFFFNLLFFQERTCLSPVGKAEPNRHLSWAFQEIWRGVITHRTQPHIIFLGNFVLLRWAPPPPQPQIKLHQKICLTLFSLSPLWKGVPMRLTFVYSAEAGKTLVPLTSFGC